MKLAKKAQKGKNVIGGPFGYIKSLESNLKTKCSAKDYTFFLSLDNIEESLINDVSYKLYNVF